VRKLDSFHAYYAIQGPVPEKISLAGESRRFRKWAPPSEEATKH